MTRAPSLAHRNPKPNRKTPIVKTPIYRIGKWTLKGMSLAGAPRPSRMSLWSDFERLIWRTHQWMGIDGS